MKMLIAMAAVAALGSYAAIGQSQDSSTYQKRFSEIVALGVRESATSTLKADNLAELLKIELRKDGFADLERYVRKYDDKYHDDEVSKILHGVIDYIRDNMLSRPETAKQYLSKIKVVLSNQVQLDESFRDREELSRRANDLDVILNQYLAARQAAGESPRRERKTPENSAAGGPIIVPESISNSSPAQEIQPRKDSRAYTSNDPSVHSPRLVYELNRYRIERGHDGKSTLVLYSDSPPIPLNTYQRKPEGKENTQRESIQRESLRKATGHATGHKSERFYNKPFYSNLLRAVAFSLAVKLMHDYYLKQL